MLQKIQILTIFRVFFLHGGALKISDMLCYGEGGIKFVDMTFSFSNYKLYKILLDFTKYHVRYHVIMIIVEVWVDLDCVPKIASTC